MLLFCCYLYCYCYNQFHFHRHLFHLYINTYLCHSLVITIFQQIIYWHNNIKIFFIFFLLASLMPVTLILPFTIIYMHCYKHTTLTLILKSTEYWRIVNRILNIEFCLTQYWQFDKSLTSIYFLSIILIQLNGSTA